MKKVLIIGTGGIGKRHIRGFLKTKRAVLSVVEPVRNKLTDILKTYQIENGYEKLEEAPLNSFDAAVICAPAHVHIPIASKCAAANLSFLVEKPLSVTTEGVEALMRTVKEKKLIACVAYVRRVGIEMQELYRRIKTGEIGDVKNCWINISQDYPKYRPDYQKIYYAKKETGGGTILDAASHVIDFLLWILGDISEVAAIYDRLVLQGVEAEDTAAIILRFKSGAIGQININQFQKPNESVIEFAGTKGNFLLEGSVLKFAADDSGKWDCHNYMEGMNLMEAHEARFSMQANMFLDALEGKPSNLTTLEEAYKNLLVALAAKESYVTKKIICLK